MTQNKLTITPGSNPESESPLSRIMSEISVLEEDLELLEREIPRMMAEVRNTTQPLLDAMVQQRRELIRWLGEELCKPKLPRRQKICILELMATVVRITRERFGAEIGEELVPFGFDAVDEEDPEDDEIGLGPMDSNRAERRKKKGKESVDPAILRQKLYYGLARELHPDKASDQNEQEERTAVMQRLNVAYKKGDLNTLLHILHIHGSEAHKASVDPESMKSLLKSLGEQRDQLRAQILLKVRNLPTAAGNWKQILSHPEKWSLVAHAQKKSAQAEVDRLDRMVKILKKPRGLSIFLKQSDEENWLELF